jgi:carbon-monoxide dehydrogenase medium subunit
MLRGTKPAASAFAAVADAASAALDEPLADVHASADYRRDLARVLTRRALDEAATRAGGRS